MNNLALITQIDPSEEIFVKQIKVGGVTHAIDSLRSLKHPPCDNKLLPYEQRLYLDYCSLLSIIKSFLHVILNLLASLPILVVNSLIQNALVIDQSRIHSNSSL